jgi:hypothetical protein
MYDCVAHGSDGSIEAMSIYVRDFLLHRRQSIVSSFMKAEAEAGELHLAHTGSKGVEYAFAATKTPSTWKREHSS